MGGGCRPRISNSTSTASSTSSRAGTLHDAMLVRAPLFMRAHNPAARELLEILRPSIVNAIRSERVGQHVLRGAGVQPPDRQSGM